MQDSIDPNRLTGLLRRRTVLLAVGALGAGLLVGGCGAGSGGPASATAGASTSASTVATGTGSATPASASTGSASTSTGSATRLPGDVPPGLAFARCMRANGVPSFPDPGPGPGFAFNTVGLSGPALNAATAQCRHLLPDGGPPIPGTQTHPSAKTMARLLSIARCMREHGVPNFPDPMTTVPSRPPGAGGLEITDFDGAILVFPGTLEMQSPAYRQAAAACGGLAEKLGRPH